MSSDGGPAFELYALGLEHKHLPETQLLCRADAAADLRARRSGITGRACWCRCRCISTRCRAGRAGADLQAALAARYRGCDYVRVLPPAPDGKLEPEALNDTNLLELRVYANEAHRQAVLVARLDNLGKGASGAAVQNLRLMLGLPGDACQPALAHA